MELSYARRHNTDLALLLFDVDHFKRVNDTYGHPAGDEVLIEIARLVRRLVRNEDVFARYGGEEFGLILRGIDISGARSVGERLRTQVEKLAIASDRGAIHVTISVGCSSIATTSEPSTEGLVQIADRRLYAAKHSGRNRVVASD
jgi:diguanylate cyclase (GGDEF)-like protein